MREKAPGCYGYATTYDAESEKCQRCAFAQRCQREAFRLLQEIQNAGQIDVTRQLARFRKMIETAEVRVRDGVKKAAVDAVFSAPLDERQKQALMTYPARVRSVCSSLIRRGVPLMAMIRAKQNPFNNPRERLQFLARPIQLLIEYGRFRRSELVRLYREDHRDWSEATAQSYASIACKALCALQITTEHNKEYRLKD